ncbi:MFS transporter [Ancylobacter vacuolatus]|uniref:EmrB/QacA subfamily drug resistance transporter n=1 Tax=Ancylobacter vacuolatus TaxID=223389 RepID=A0ABU0DDN3_9HYPH|nr:MFS transporter [Ancylobacter vacuolatus]MDQ0346497.1 EmrB/QacA subfamily drug resistance transporter [Ancylobacter vacuolatus]
MVLPLNRLLIEPAPLAWLERQSWHSWLVVALVCVGAFVGQLDATIVQLALPAIGRAFDAPLQDVSWVALSYLLAFASFLPVFGRLCESYGRKSLYLAGYTLFIVASALCALADSFSELLAFRFLQGMGGALLGANSIAILVRAIPEAQRGRALGYFAAAQAVGMSAGPALGGFIVDGLGWRWIFGITVPFGAIAILVGWLALPRSTDTGGKGTFDWGGALMIGPALILLVGTLNHVSSWGLAAPLTLGSLALAAFLLWQLVRRERRTASPLIDPRLFASAAFRWGALAVVLGYGLLYGVFFLMSFGLAHGYGESAAEAGLRLALVPVALGLTAPFSHEIRSFLGARRIGVAGMAVCLAGLVILWLTFGLSPWHHWFDTLSFVLIGIGLGLFVAPNSAVTIAAAPAGLAGAAGSLLNLMRVLGTSLGVAAGATALAWRLGAETGSGAQGLGADGASLLAAVRTALPLLAAMAVLAAVAARAAAAPPARSPPPG